MAKFGESMRGLTVFISDIRNCKSKEAERKRINKELANIRSKFKSDKLDGYQKKKYVCKLVFIFLLGNDLNFGYQEAVNLLSSIRFTEKQIGYLFVTVLMGHGHDLMPLVIQAIRHDMESRNPVFNTLAMQCVANIASKEMAEQLGKDAVPNLLTSADSNSAVRQTAALCLLKLLRVDPKIIPTDKYSSIIIKLLNNKHLGLVTCVCSLLEELARINPTPYQECVSTAVAKLAGIVTKSHSDMQDYTYYFVPAPWLCVKLMKLLQCFPMPTDAIVKARLNEAIDAVLKKASDPSKSRKIQHSNAKNAVLFETVNLIVHFDSEAALQVQACNLLGGFLTHKETNLRYLSLEGLCNLASSEFSHEAVKKHQETVLNALKTERDISVRQKAIDLLYAMCDHTNAQTIVEELLSYLERADYSIREALVLKIAILAEKYAHDYTWYVDTILNLIRLAGDYVSEEVWYRIIQIVINKQDVQGYAAKTCFEALQAPACHENMIKVGGYILGEFGNLVAGDSRSAPMVQFQLLHSKYPFCSLGTRALLLSTYVKFINLYPEIKDQVQQILQMDSQSRNPDLELQQRAIEYLKLSHIASHDLMATVLEEMPQFPERDSLLLSKLYKTAPWTAKLHESSSETEVKTETKAQPAPVAAPLQPAPVAAAAPAPVGDGLGDLLIDVAPVAAPLNVSDIFSSSLEPAATSGPVVSSLAEEGFQRFLFKNSGVLFENDLLQVGIKSEFKKNLGRIGIFYGNKTRSTMLNFSSAVVPNAELDKLVHVEVIPISPTLDVGAQVQQVANVECKQIFTQTPLLKVNFSVGGTPHDLILKLPVMVAKFCEPAVMNAQDFFKRWKQLQSPTQECQRIFDAKKPMDAAVSSEKLKGVGLSVLPGVDPNADNFVSAGIITTTAALIGCLARLEPNFESKKYRLTIRSSHEGVPPHLCDTLMQQL